MVINFLFFFLAAIALILCQTIFLPGTALFDQGVDLLFIVVFQISLTFSHFMSVASIMLLGAVMDSISGAPFFIHMFSYVWVYLIIKLSRQFVFHRSTLFVIAVSIAAISIQQVLVLFSIFVSQGQSDVSNIDYSLLSRQLLLGAIYIPCGVWVLNVMRQIWTTATRRYQSTMARREGR